jgi:hypothetical protein
MGYCFTRLPCGSLLIVFIIVLDSSFKIFDMGSLRLWNVLNDFILCCVKKSRLSFNCEIIKIGLIVSKIALEFLFYLELLCIYELQ